MAAWRYFGACIRDSSCRCTVAVVPGAEVRAERWHDAWAPPYCMCNELVQEICHEPCRGARTEAKLQRPDWCTEHRVEARSRQTWPNARNIFCSVDRWRQNRMAR